MREVPEEMAERVGGNIDSHETFWKGSSTVSRRSPTASARPEKERGKTQGLDTSSRRQKFLAVSTRVIGGAVAVAVASGISVSALDRAFGWEHLVVGVVLILSWTANSGGLGSVDNHLARSFLDDSMRVARHILLGSMIVALGALLLTRDVDLVSFTVLAAGLGAVFIPAARGAAPLLLGQSRTRSRRRVLIIGAGRVGWRVARLLHQNPRLGCEVVGFLDKDPLKIDGEPEVEDIPVLGSSYDLSRVIKEYGVSEVIFAFSTAPHQRVLEMVWECDRHKVGVSMVPRYFETVTTPSNVENVSGMPIMHLDRVRLRGWNVVLKRAFDLFGATVGLLLLSPLLLAIAVAVRLDSPGPVIFTQKRVGFDGQTFDIYKFRSMRLDAESIGTWTQKQDPRRTSLGRILRMFNLDELPQLMNVLKGEMSLVGPRPEQPSYVEVFEESVYRYAHRHRVKSGITGWAQISGLRGDTSIEERVLFDNYYIENWSLWLDVKIMILTVFSRAMICESERKPISDE